MSRLNELIQGALPESVCRQAGGGRMNDKCAEAVRTIKTAILNAQNRAAKHTDAEMLSLYCIIGGYVSGNSRKCAWGTGAIDEISARLREELPGLRGFSAENIKLMRRFYEEWQPCLQNNGKNLLAGKSAAAAADLEMQPDAPLLLAKNRRHACRRFGNKSF